MKFNSAYRTGGLSIGSAYLAAIGAMALAVQAAAAQTPAPRPDAANGEVLARRWCASCHIVSGDQKMGASDAPTFASIGRRSEITPEGLALFLLSPHPRMPDMALTRKEAADIVAYIRSQGK